MAIEMLDYGRKAPRRKWPVLGWVSLGCFVAANGALVRASVLRDPSWIEVIMGLNLAGAVLGVAAVGIHGSGKTFSPIAALANAMEFFVWVVIVFMGRQ
jgi:hypothetical protein